jgi:hypothetical protein
MIPEWRIAQIRFGATQTAQGLSEGSLRVLATVTEGVHDSLPPSDERTELAIAAAAFRDEVARRAAEKNDAK